MKSRAVAPAIPGTSLWIALLAVSVLVGLSSPWLRAESPASFFRKGADAEARDDYDGAYTYFQKAFLAAPKDLRYKAAYYRVRVNASSLHIGKGRKLVQSGDEQGALAEFLHAAEIDPGNEAAQQEIAHLRQKQGIPAPSGESSLPVSAEKQEEIDSMGSPAMLKPLSNEPLTLHMTEDAKVVYQAVGKAAGVNVLFDPDFTSKRVQVDLNGVSLLDALRIVGTVTNTFWRPVTENTLFVAQNSRSKRTELDEQAVQTFYLTNAWQQNDLNDVNTALRNVMPNSKVYPVPSQNAIVMRGTPDELLLAQKLIDDLDKARPEVVVDIAVLEVNKNWERNLGLSWPSSASVALQTSTTTSSTSSTSSTTTSTTPTIYDLAHLKAADFAVTIGSATANLLLSDSNTKILQNPRIRCTDSQKATMKIGTRIPIATGSYSSGAGVTTSVASSLVNTQFQYIDVGVNIEMTPTVHYDHDVTLKIKIEDSSENGSVTISGVTEPIIAQKTSEQTIRLREGEASVLTGILNRSDELDWSGVPGLSSIPGLKYLFGSKDHKIVDDEIVFLLIPHIVRAQDLEPANLRTIDTGVGQTIDLRLNASPKQVPAPAPVTAPGLAPGLRQSPAGRPTRRSHAGTVPGESAENAAPNAIAQMRADAEATGIAPPSPELPLPAAESPAGPEPAEGLALSLTAPVGPVAVGATFNVPVVLAGGKDIAAVPMQISYDPAKVSLISVDSGEFLGRDGQAVALVHRDDGPGKITFNASRPPGAAGISGDGTVCVLVFQAKAAGDSNLTITRSTATNSAQKTLAAKGGSMTVQVK